VTWGILDYSKIPQVTILGDPLNMQVT
jgi:hypothetical protein